MLNKVAVISSNIASAGWDSNTMEITFTNNSTYQASGIPKTAYDSFMASTSKGQHFNKILKTAYTWKKIG